MNFTSLDVGHFCTSVSLPEFCSQTQAITQKQFHFLVSCFSDMLGRTRKVLSLGLTIPPIEARPFYVLFSIPYEQGFSSPGLCVSVTIPSNLVGSFPSIGQSPHTYALINTLLNTQGALHLSPVFPFCIALPSLVLCPANSNSLGLLRLWSPSFPPSESVRFHLVLPP